MAYRYKLLRDLPNMKADMIYVNAKEHDNFTDDKWYIPVILDSSGKDKLCIHSDFVENNPTWFQKVEEEPVKDNKNVLL